MQRLLLNALRITQVDRHLEPVTPAVAVRRRAKPRLKALSLGKREYPLQRPCRFRVCGDRRDYQGADRRLRCLPGCILRHVLIGALGKPAGTEGIELLPRFLRALKNPPERVWFILQSRWFSSVCLQRRISELSNVAWLKRNNKIRVSRNDPFQRRPISHFNAKL